MHVLQVHERQRISFFPFSSWFKWSPSPPLRKSGKDALSRSRSPDSRPNYTPTLRAFPSSGQWLYVADFVAGHSCEGSGGITPLFPLTSGASWFIKREWQRPRNLLPHLTIERLFARLLRLPYLKIAIAIKIHLVAFRYSASGQASVVARSIRIQDRSCLKRAYGMI